MDVHLHRRPPAARRRGEDEPSGTDAHGGGRVADPPASGPTDAVDTEPACGPAADRGRRAHIRLQRGTAGMGWPLAAGAGAPARIGTPSTSPAADPPGLG